jgi:hypothetical protein
MPAARSLALAVVAVAVAVAAAASARPAAAQTTITFASNACAAPVQENIYRGLSFDTQGFRFTTSSIGFRTPCSGNPFGYTGTTTLYNDGTNATTTLTSLAATPFSIQSIDLAPLGRDSRPQLVTFIGTLVGGATVTQAFTIPGGAGLPTLATYTFQPTFANLTSLQFSPQTAPFYQFTNLRLDQAVVPEPGTWALLGTGLLGVAGIARRRRRA